MSIKSIKIQNEYLPCNEVQLNFMKQNGDLFRELLIFGRNGTGKSTMSTMINDYKKNMEMNGVNIEYLDDINQKTDFFIFDENFVDKHIKFSDSNNLDAIVMFGEQADLDERINILKNRKIQFSNREKYYGNKVENYNHKEEIKKVLNHLKGDNNWAGREKAIDNKAKKNKNVDTNTLKRVLKHENQESIEFLHKDLVKHKELINSLEDKKEISEIPNVEGIGNDSQKLIINILKRTDSIKFTKNIDKKVEKIFEEYGNSYIVDLSEYLKSKPEYCKTCLRPLDDEYINNLRDKLKYVFQNDLLEETTNEINKIVNEIITDRKEVQNNHVETVKINNLIKCLNLESLKIKELLKDKMNSLNKLIEYKFDDYNKILEKINGEVEKLNEEIRIYNNQIKRITEIKKEYSKLNYKIAFKEIEKVYNDYKEKQEEYKVYEFKRNRWKLLCDDIETRINKLNTKQKQTSIALDMMNDELALIFFDKNRLVLDGKENYYEILVRGNSIPLSKLSTGEKNVLALVYFFSLVNKEKKVEDLYKNTFFIMLDDPISSFDFENKIGIYNYLRKQFKSIFSNNEYSQIMLTTHDMEVYKNFEKVFEDIVLDNGDKLTKRANKYILTVNGLENDRNGKKNNIYNLQLNAIYDFAIGKLNVQAELENYIGNTMRRVLEAFSTFKYRTGIDSLRTDKNIINLITNSKLNTFFENYLFRLILNNESHNEDNYKGITDKALIEYLTLNEKVKTAKLLILFLYELDDMHVIKHIDNSNDKNDVVSQIETWKEEIIKLTK
ncbi:AAA family ATPase [Staphylococcus epidermidis]|uniref:AAA family ATPase n=1 Tax=Staphylococcus epidermidis TaxID=1282 RepID=UPI0020039007|nr:AAA family ATPase [Staphylococcus epidermidis]MCG1406161.1 AAA family ATPase [Staphylococcus epidermidis]MCG1410788.1 AAA family ATPase [Staphylococcus epidermidis]MCG1413149.1 AAA family ATPase [Staphylococcus epidermidis]MCG1911324.1 AAA family ATPase [Staphylococcus epidermidis]